MDNVAKLKKWHIVFSLLFIVVAGSLFFYQRLYWPKVTAELDGEKLELLWAKNFYQQRKGLGKRDSIEPYDGMIFTFGLLARHAIVMRDMRFPIDIVWLKDGEVVDMAQAVQTEDVPEENLTRYYPRVVADMVIEFPAGRAAQLGLKIGDRVAIVY